MYAGHKIVKAFGHEQKSVEKFDNINESLYESGWRAQFISGIIMPMMSFIGNIGYVLISVVGGIMVMRRTIDDRGCSGIHSICQTVLDPITQTPILRISFNRRSLLLSAYLNCWTRRKKCRSEQRDNRSCAEATQEMLSFKAVLRFGYKDQMQLIIERHEH